MRLLSFLLLVPTLIAAQPTLAAVASQQLSPEDVRARAGASVVQVISSSGRGSAFQVGAGLLTDEHVVGDAQQVDIVTADGRRASAQVLKTDAGSNLALLKASVPIAPLQLAAARDQTPGDPVLLLGYPTAPNEPSSSDSRPTITPGVLLDFRNDEVGLEYVRTDAAITPGLPGGALLNLRGQVIGLAEYGFEKGDAANYAIPSEVLQSFLDTPPTRVAPGPLFASPLTSVGLNVNDFGPDWNPLQPAARGLADQLGLGPEDRSGVLMSAFSQPGPQGAAVINLVWDRSTADQAHADFLREMRGTIGELLRLADPLPGDECRAWQGLATGGTLTIVVCRLDNVVFEAAVVGRSQYATEDFALSYMGLMAERVRQQAF